MTIHELQARDTMHSTWSTSIEVRADEAEAATVFRQAFGRILEALADQHPMTPAGEDFPEAIVCAEGGTCRLSMSRELGDGPRGVGRWRLSLHIGDADASALPQARLSLALHGQPFTRRETETFAAEQPLMRSLAARHSALAPLAGSEFVVTGHFVTDLVHQIDCLIAAGARPGNITVLQKEYAYRYRHRVAASLRDRGIRIVSAADASGAVRRSAEHASAAGLRCVGIDDGGYIAPAVLAEPGWVQALWDGVVEQTMSGIFRIEDRLDRLPFPVVSVAQSQLKCVIEPRWIADAVVSRIFGLLTGSDSDREAALVLGYGNIGAQIAARLRARGMRVSVYDTDILKLVDAHESGFRTGLGMAELIAAEKPQLIIGATGRTSIGESELAAISGNVILASATSRDIEFDLAALARRSIRDPEFAHDMTRYRLVGGSTVGVLASGRPINFHEADGMPNSCSDLICAALLLGALALVDDGVALTCGVHPDECDRLIADSGLLRAYYEHRA